MKFVLIVCLVNLTTFAAGNLSCFGCMRERDSGELKKSEELLAKSLTKLANAGGPYYRLIKINHAFTQVVTGTKEVINADLKDQEERIKTCKIEIFLVAWIDTDIRVTFDCPGEKKIVKAHRA